MTEVYSESGVNSLKENMPKYCLIFEDNTCPMCGNKLELENKHAGNNTIYTKYTCSCGFICPVRHNIDEELNDTISPLYDSTISDFISSLEKSINKKVERKMRKRRNRYAREHNDT